MGKDESQFEKKLKKYHKDKLIYSGNDKVQFYVPRIPTGIFIMDCLTGGGIPVSRVTEFYGAKSSTKSSNVLRIIGNFLKLHPRSRALLADIEGSYTNSWAMNFIQDINRLHVLLPEYGEQAINVIKDLINEEELGLLAIDSVANLIPIKEVEGDAEDATIGLHAKLLNRLLRIMFNVIMSRRKTDNPLTVIVVNQLRANVGARRFQSPTIKPGGMMQDFLYSMDIRLWTTEVIKVAGVSAKSKHEFSIEKNKLGLYKRTGEFTMNLLNIDGNSPVGGIDELPTVVKYAIKYGVIVKAGSKWHYKKHVFPNMESISAALVTDPSLYEAVRSETLEACITNITIPIEEGK